MKNFREASKCSGLVHRSNKSLRTLRSTVKIRLTVARQTRAFVFLFVNTWLCLDMLPSPWYNHTGWLGVKHQFTYWICFLGGNKSKTTTNKNWPRNGQKQPPKKVHDRGLEGGRSGTWLTRTDSAFKRFCFFKTCFDQPLARIKQLLKLYQILIIIRICFTIVRRFYTDLN